MIARLRAAISNRLGPLQLTAADDARARARARRLELADLAVLGAPFFCLPADLDLDRAATAATPSTDGSLR